MQFSSFLTQAVLMVALLITALLVARKKASSLLRKIKWFMLSILVVMSWNTPGEFIQPWPFAWAPTYEGVHIAVQHSLVIINMVLVLALFLTYTAKETLIAGIYTLMRPFKLLGLNPERFAARVWLTLHYVERRPLQGWAELNKEIRRIVQPQSNSDIATDISSLALHIPTYNSCDVVFFALYAALAILGLVLVL